MAVIGGRKEVVIVRILEKLFAFLAIIDKWISTMAEPELSLSMSSIVAHVGEGKRCWEEGEAVLKAKHIVACGVTARGDNELKILALCCSIILFESKAT